MMACCGIHMRSFGLYSITKVKIKAKNGTYLHMIFEFFLCIWFHWKYPLRIVRNNDVFFKHISEFGENVIFFVCYCFRQYFLSCKSKIIVYHRDAQKTEMDEFSWRWTQLLLGSALKNKCIVRVTCRKWKWHDSKDQMNSAGKNERSWWKLADSKWMSQWQEK